MSGRAAPWRNVVVRYCPRCRLVFPVGVEKCDRCGAELVDQVRREKLEEK